MVQTKWRSPTISALLVAVKLDFPPRSESENSPLHNHGDWRPISRNNSAQSQGSAEKQSSYI